MKRRKSRALYFSTAKTLKRIRQIREMKIRGTVDDSGDTARVLNFEIVSEMSPERSCLDSPELQDIPEYTIGDNQHAAEVPIKSNWNSAIEGLAMDRERGKCIWALELIVFMLPTFQETPA